MSPWSRRWPPKRGGVGRNGVMKRTRMRSVLLDEDAWVHKDRATYALGWRRPISAPWPASAVGRVAPSVAVAANGPLPAPGPKSIRLESHVLAVRLPSPFQQKKALFKKMITDDRDAHRNHHADARL